jgi:hypothetical protein
MHGPDEVAYWLEIAEAHVYAGINEAHADDPLGPGVIAHGDARTFWMAGLDIGFFNRSIGLGIDRPATEADLDAAIGAFRDAGLSQYAVTVSPLARPAGLERWLQSRGFRRGRRLSKFWRDVEDLPDVPTPLRIEAIGADRRDDFVRVGLTAFEMPEAVGTLFGAGVGSPGWTAYLAFDRDEPVGTAAMRIFGDVAWFGYGSMLESQRGKGGQAALFARRLRDARDAGVTLCVTETGEELPDEPNPSSRNMLRVGFRLAYHRQNWLPPAA